MAACAGSVDDARLHPKSMVRVTPIRLSSSFGPAWPELSATAVAPLPAPPWSIRCPMPRWMGSVAMTALIAFPSRRHRQRPVSLQGVDRADNRRGQPASRLPTWPVGGQRHGPGDWTLPCAGPHLLWHQRRTIRHQSRRTTASAVKPEQHQSAGWSGLDQRSHASRASRQYLGSVC